MFSQEKPEGQSQIERSPKYDAILVLGAQMVWNDKKQEWTFPTVKQDYAGKLVMGKARAIATSEIENEASSILVTGGKEIHPETGEPHSRAIELSRLINEYGVSKDKIFPIGEGGNTIENANDAAKYLESNPNIIKTKKIAILCPKFQYERAKMMFETNHYFKNNDIEVSWLMVEDILGERSAHYKNWENKVYSTPEAAINKELEQKGMENFKSGSYKPKTN